MPFLSSFGGALNIGFGLSRTTGESVVVPPYNGTMYYYEGTDETDTTSTWATLSKWYKNSSHTQSAAYLPTANNATVLLNNTSADLETWTAPASIDITGKTLSLTAHNLGEGCEAAKQFSTPVTATSASELVLSGHINITGITHPLYTYDSATQTYYYFDADIDVNDYIYQNKYSNTIAAVALYFAIEQSGTLYNITTNSSGKVITKVPFTIDQPEDDNDHDVMLSRLSGFGKFSTYSGAWVVEGRCPYPLELSENALGPGQNQTGKKLFVPPAITDPGVFVGYVYSLVYTINEETGERAYLDKPVPFEGIFSIYKYTETNGLRRFIKITTNAEGRAIKKVLC